jgi:hypothetical protein
MGRQSSVEQSSDATPPPQTPALTEPEAVEDYLRQIDAVVGGSAAIADPQPFAARLLQQGMSGDGQHLDSVLARTRQAEAELQGVAPPAQCQEHYGLLMSQLQQSEDLLSEVKAANATGDTARLANLAAAGQTAQGDSLRLQELDRSLRQSVR